MAEDKGIMECYIKLTGREDFEKVDVSCATVDKSIEEASIKIIGRIKPLTITDMRNIIRIEGMNFPKIGIKDLRMAPCQCENSKKLKKDLPNLPKRYLINHHVAVCIWEDGTITKSKVHEDSEFDKEIGFLMCCFQHYYAKMSKTKRKKILSWVNWDRIKEFLFEIFVEKSGLNINEARRYLENLEVKPEKTEVTVKKITAKILKETVSNSNKGIRIRFAKRDKDD